MTTTLGAVPGILVAGAKRHSTLQATAPQRTTTPLMDVRIHPALYTSVPVSSPTPPIGQLLLSWTRCDLAWVLLAPVFAVGLVRGEGSKIAHADDRGSEPLLARCFIETEGCRDGRTAAAELVAGLQRRQMCPVVVIELLLLSIFSDAGQPHVATDVIKLHLKLPVCILTHQCTRTVVVPNKGNVSFSIGLSSPPCISPIYPTLCPSLSMYVSLSLSQWGLMCLFIYEL